MAITSYAPNNAYSSLMYGNKVQYGSSGGTAPGMWVDRFGGSGESDVAYQAPSYNTAVANVIEETYRGEREGDGRDDAEKMAEEAAEFEGKVSNPYNDAWASQAFGEWGKGLAKNVAITAGMGAVAGLDFGTSMDLGMSTLNEQNVVGGFGNVLSKVGGIQSNPKANAAITMAGTMFGGPVAGLIANVAAPAISDGIMDALGLRGYEDVRDTLEDSADGYFAGRTAGTAYAEAMDRLSKGQKAYGGLSLADILGTTNTAAAALGGPMSTAKFSNVNVQSLDALAKATGLTVDELSEYSNLGALQDRAMIADRLSRDLDLGGILPDAVIDNPAAYGFEGTINQSAIAGAVNVANSYAAMMGQKDLTQAQQDLMADKSLTAMAMNTAAIANGGYMTANNLGNTMSNANLGISNLGVSTPGINTSFNSSDLGSWGNTAYGQSALAAANSAVANANNSYNDAMGGWGGGSTSIGGWGGGSDSSGGYGYNSSGGYGGYDSGGNYSGTGSGSSMGGWGGSATSNAANQTVNDAISNSGLGWGDSSGGWGGGYGGWGSGSSGGFGDSGGYGGYGSDNSGSGGGYGGGSSSGGGYGGGNGGYGNGGGYGSEGGGYGGGNASEGGGYADGSGW